MQLTHSRGPRLLKEKEMKNIFKTWSMDIVNQNHVLVKEVCVCVCARWYVCEVQNVILGTLTQKFKADS